jgi:hypothetical protein
VAPEDLVFPAGLVDQVGQVDLSDREGLVSLAAQEDLLAPEDLVFPAGLVDQVGQVDQVDLSDREGLVSLAAPGGPSGPGGPCEPGGPGLPCGPGGPGGPGGKLPTSALPRWPVTGFTSTAWFGAAGLIAVIPAINIAV